MKRKIANPEVPKRSNRRVTNPRRKAVQQNGHKLRKAQTLGC